MPASDAICAVRAAIGARFRLHGRDAATGLDCVGVAALALRACGRTIAVPTGYALRGGDAAAVAAVLDAALERASRPAPGDLVLLSTGPAQLHLAVTTDDGFVHADAMLRRVVERPGPLPWAVVGRWRIGEA